MTWPQKKTGKTGLYVLVGIEHLEAEGDGTMCKGREEERRGRGRTRGLAPLCVSRLRAFLNPSSGACVPFVC